MNLHSNYYICVDSGKLNFVSSFSGLMQFGDINSRLILFFEFELDWLQSLKQVFINVSYHIRVASLTLMASI